MNFSQTFIIIPDIGFMKYTLISKFISNWIEQQHKGNRREKQKMGDSQDTKTGLVRLYLLSTIVLL